MTQQCLNLVESLRQELREYGELLALLETEQGEVARQNADDLLVIVHAIHSQGDAIRAARLERAQRQRDLARSLQMPAGSRIDRLTPLLPPAHQILLNALLEECNQLLLAVRQRARQNRALLRRSLELMERFISSFCGAAAAASAETGAVASSPGFRHRPRESPA